jgi:hypothetical protein
MMNLDDARPTGNIRGALVLQSAVPGTKVIVKLRYDTGTVPAQGAGARDGLWVHQGAYDITFKDLLFMPSPTATIVDDDLVKCDENNNTTATIVNTITFDGCIFTDGFTSGTQRVPKIKSKADLIAMNFPADMTAFTPAGGMASGDDLLKYWGDATPIVERQNCTIKDCVFFTKNARCLEGVTAGTTETLLIQDSLFAMGAASYVVTARPYNDDCFVNIIGTKDPRQGDLTKCTAVLCASAHPLYTSGGGTYPIGDTTIKNVLVSVYNGTATATRPISGGAEGKLIEDSIFFVDRFPGNMVDYALTKNSVYNRDTFHSPTDGSLVAQNLFYLGEAADPFGIIMTDCVISGANMPALNNASGLDVGGFHLYNCDIALAGPDAITSTGLTATFHNCTFVDPMYLSKDRKLESFFDTSNPVLFGARSDAGGLGGGAHFRVADAGDNIDNIFQPFGDCETDIFKIASYRSDWGDPLDGYGLASGDIFAVQDQVAGVIGNADWIHHATGRMEAGTESCAMAGKTDGGTDVIASFYYKVPAINYSYPRVAVRLDPRVPPFITGQGEVNDCAAPNGYKEWTNTSLTVDNNWHQLSATLTTVNFTGRTTANFFTNNYAVPSWFIDEIVLDDPSVATRVEDWGLF